MKKIKLLPLLAVVMLTTGCSGTRSQTYGIDEYSKKSDALKIQYHDGFKIMQLSDLHFSNYDNLDEDFNYLEYLIKDANPDLFVITGDVFTFASLSRVRKVFNFFNSFDIPWTVTFGNHDEQVYGAYNYPSIYASDLSNCLLNYHEDDVLTGTGNSIVNLYDGDNIKFQLYVVDSNSYTYDPIGYDYVHNDQIEWYKNAVEYANKTINPSFQLGDETLIKSLIFQHIPLQEYKDAWEATKTGEATYDGEHREGVAPSKFNSGFYKTIKDCKSSVAMFVGHDHNNNTNVHWDNFNFVFGCKSTDNMYHDKELLGYRLITLDLSTPELFTTNTNYVTYEEAR